jgi:hypothetical protein
MLNYLLIPLFFIEIEILVILINQLVIVMLNYPVMVVVAALLVAYFFDYEALIRITTYEASAFFMKLVNLQKLFFLMSSE